LRQSIRPSAAAQPFSGKGGLHRKAEISQSTCKKTNALAKSKERAYNKYRRAPAYGG
jgi:hypothetical protein